MWGNIAAGLQLVAAMGVLIGAGILLHVADGSCADLQPLDRNTLLTLQPGEVNANHGEEIVIDNKRYVMSPSVTIMDDEGRSRDLKSVVPGTQVRFRLRQGTIDLLVMMLPR
jgi:hypothetical protein